MSVLSESTIRKYLEKGEIIAPGFPDNKMIGNSYPCRAAKIFMGGPGSTDRNSVVADWTNPTGQEFFRVQPRQIVWVRIREMVKLPSDICAFWWQTNTLARKGLMLVNMSMVESGYEGPLACLFVNFGREPINLDPSTIVARLVFHRIEGQGSIYGKGPTLEEYDRTLRDVAMTGPSSFLSFHEFSGAFEQERNQAFAQFRNQADAHTLGLKNDVDKKANDVMMQVGIKVESLFQEKVDNLPRFLWKSYAIAGAGFLLLTLALSITPWIRDHLGLDVKGQIQTAVETEIGRRLQPISTVNNSSNEALEKRISELESVIRTLSEPKPVPVPVNTGPKK